MARDVLKIDFDLDRIVCHDEGDGWGNAEPYLWTVFFKIDGDTISVTEGLTLAGNATVQTTPGSHGNLNDSSVDAGDTVQIPAAIGRWDTNLKPIPVPEAFQAFAEDVGGVVGVVCVLMEEDNVSDDGAEAGHQALNGAVASALDQIVAGLSFTNQEVTDGDIAALTGGISSVVSSAIQSQQNFFENLWSAINPDDKIGHKIFFFTHDDLAAGGTTTFSHRWRNEGDWEIHGSITATPLCPAGALDGLFAGRMERRAMSAERAFDGEPAAAELTEGRAFDLGTLRKFREGAYQQMPGLGQWWKLAERNVASVVKQAVFTPGLQKPLAQLLEYAPKAVSEPGAKIDDEMLDLADEVLAVLGSKTRNRRLAVDTSRARALIPRMRGTSVAETMKMMNALNPARHPKDADGRRIKPAPE